MFFILIFGDNLFLLLILVNYVRDDSRKKILAPSSPNGFDIIDDAICSTHRCTI